MKSRYIFLLLFLFTFFSSCKDKTKPPAPFGALPIKAQLSWHEMEYFSLVCYGLNTYTEVEWAYGDVNPELFKPTDLNTDQWAETAKKAGMKGLILVAKHHDGFCLWPSKYTDYSVASTPWKNGEGDVLGDLAESCKKYGIKLGVYLSPWDRNHAEYGRPEYVDYYYKQLEELLTEYGDIFEFWIDAANGGTGYYGGANERRNIDRKTYYGYENIFKIVYKHQPDAIIFSDVGPGSRWVGNEAGIGGETNWNTISTQGKAPGEADAEFRKKLQTGEAGGNQWIPAEVNTTLLWPKVWYYHHGYKPRSVANLMDLYYTSIGRGSPLNLGLAITPEGRVSKADSLALISFRKQVDFEFETNLLKNAEVTATNVRGNSKKFGINHSTDSSSDTYWASDDGVQKVGIEIDFGKEQTFNRLLLQENIALGQRIHKFKLETEKENSWEEVISGTTIGYKRALRLDAVTATKARITLETEAPCLTLSNLGLFNAPELTEEPKFERSADGVISIISDEKNDIFYNLNSIGFQKYSSPISLPKGGKLETYAIDNSGKFKSEVISKEFGIAKSKWSITDVSSETIDGPAKSAIDAYPHTVWTSKESSSNHFITINLGESVLVSGFSYVPCKRNCEGTIYEYEFYTSKDSENWSKPFLSGEFANIENNPTEHIIKFDTPVSAKFVKLVAKSTLNDNKRASAAEIEIFIKLNQ